MIFLYNNVDCQDLPEQIGVHGRNLHIFRKGHTQTPEKINVLAKILGNYIVGLTYPKDNVTDILYLEILQNLINSRNQEISVDNQDKFKK